MKNETPTPTAGTPGRPWLKLLAALAAALLAALGGAGAASAAEAAPPPAVAGPAAVGEHTLARFEAVNVPPKAALLWRVTPAEKIDRATTPRGRFEFAAPPGEYVVELLVITVSPDGAADVAEVRHKVRVGGPSQAPPGKALDPVAAIGRITFGSAGCTATVIHPRRPDGRWDVLTAAHCTETGVGSRGSMLLKDGTRFGVTVAARDTAADVCWLVTDRADLAELPAAELAAELPAVGVKVWHMGFGVDKPGNREDGVVTGQTPDGKLRFTLSVSSGDSGGAIVRADTGHVVACVCCTTGKGARVTMFGGHCLSARALRPAARADHPDTPE